MANLTLTRQWVENIYQLETSDPVMGGPDGVDNRQAKELGARTNWLKDQLDTINQDRTGYAPKASPAFTGIPTAPTANLGTNTTQIATTAFVKNAIATDLNALHDLFVGIPIPYPLSTVPTGCLAMNGQRFDTRRYQKLAQKYPSGVLPDLRGEFIRGWDNGRGVDAGRVLLSAQGDAIRNIIGEVNTDNGWFFNTLSGAFYDSKEPYTNQQKQRTRAQVIQAEDVSDFKKGYFGFDASRVVPTANETRPRNIAYHYICLAE